MQPGYRSGDDQGRAGGVLRASAELTPDGWRLSELTMRPTWRTDATTRMFLPAHR